MAFAFGLQVVESETSKQQGSSRVGETRFKHQLSLHASVSPFQVADAGGRGGDVPTPF